jgi:hypothetical protein
MAIGRDGSFMHGAMLLYRYLADEHYLEIARDSIRDLAASQWPDGTFGDQGGGAGIHGRAAFIIKPWMGYLATHGVLDYLEHFPDDALALGIVEKFANWLMTARGPRHGGKVIGWTYQYPFRARPRLGMPLPDYPGPQLHQVHLEYLARLMTFWSVRTGDPRFFDAYVESAVGRGAERTGGYGEGAAVFYFVPWLQAKLWNAQPTPSGGLSVRPVFLGGRTPRTGKILAPSGPIELKWTEDGLLTLPRGAGVRARPLRLSAVRARARRPSARLRGQAPRSPV